MAASMQPDAMQGKVALVTGAGSGIGRASSLAFASLGAQVVVSDIAPDGGEETVALIRAAGGEATFIQADVAQATDVQSLIHAIVERYGRLDYAHNNAGIEGAVTSMLDYPDDMYDKVLAINLKGVWLCLKAEIRQMLAQGGGAIVNTSSVAGLRGSPILSAYSASKHGVIGLTMSAAKEFAGRGVRVNAVCPGIIKTPMADRAFPPAFQDAAIQAHPMGRLGAPEDVAQMVAWLCSDAAAFVTGGAFTVDGGTTL